MSANTAGLVVTFENNISDESVEQLRDLLKWLDGVIDVQPVTDGVDLILAQSRADHDWRMAILGLLKEKANL